MCTHSLSPACAHTCAHASRHMPLSTRVCSDSSLAASVNGVQRAFSPLRTPEGERYGVAGIQIRDTKQKNPQAQPGEKKLINVSVPLFIKQELTRKYSQNPKVRSADSSVNAQQLRLLPALEQPRGSASQLDGQGSTVWPSSG